MYQKWFLWFVKISLALCLLICLIFPDIPGVEGKGWPERSLGYPLSALIFPIVWHLRGRRVKYPYIADSLFVLPFVLDLLGNLLNLFDTVDSFDDILHFINWGFLVAALVTLLWPASLERWNIVLLGTGFGAIAIIAWEAIEWVIQEMGTTGLQLTYDDTVGDLVLSTAGGLFGALLTVMLLTKSKKQQNGQTNKINN